MTWKSERPSIPKLLLESLRFFLPRAPKLMACYLPYYFFGWATVIFIDLLQHFGVMVYDPDGPWKVLTNASIQFLTWYLGVACVSWATVRSLESEEPTFSETVCRSFRHLGTLCLTAILGLVPISLLYLIIGMMDFFEELDAHALRSVLGAFGAVLLFTIATFLVIRLRLIRAVAVVEETRLFGCILRSYTLTKGSSFYILFLFLIQLLATLGTLVLLKLIMGKGFDNIVAYFGFFILGSLLHAMALVLFSGVMDGVLYHHLRRLKEARA